MTTYRRTASGALLLTMLGSACSGESADLRSSPAADVQAQPAANLTTQAQPNPSPSLFPSPSAGPTTGVSPLNLKEHGPGGSPLMYYGRARYKTIAQYHMLDFFGMNNQNVPFFDEYDRTKFSATPEEPWLYAIASGAQWNLLTSNPKFVEGVEINPARPGVV